MNSPLKTTGNIAILGAQWGDEGKGKLVDALADQFDFIARSTGGANAGHTIMHAGKKYIFHLLPSGLLHPQNQAVIGNGTVLDLPALLAEVKKLETQSLPVRERLWISDRAHLLLSAHKLIDQHWEAQRGTKKIGTTGRGIGPCYADKVMRLGIQLRDLADAETLRGKLSQNRDWYQQLYGLEFSAEKEFEAVQAAYLELKDSIVDTREMLHQAMAEKKRILFEGAQAHQLDLDHGTYPYVTASSVTVGGICTGLGLPPRAIDYTIGVAKAYTTRVGEGELPTEISGSFGEQLREQGQEYGATTGRPRRCGWFDARLVRQAVQVNGFDELFLTKLDVLSGLPEIKVAVSNESSAENPTYQSFTGWEESIASAQTWEDLPSAAQNYVQALEELVGCQIRGIGVGPERESVIWKTS